MGGQWTDPGNEVKTTDRLPGKQICIHTCTAAHDGQSITTQVQHPVGTSIHRDTASQDLTPFGKNITQRRTHDTRFITQACLTTISEVITTLTHNTRQSSKAGYQHTIHTATSLMPIATIQVRTTTPPPLTLLQATKKLHESTAVTDPQATTTVAVTSPLLTVATDAVPPASVKLSSTMSTQVQILTDIAPQAPTHPHPSSRTSSAPQRPAEAQAPARPAKNTTPKSARNTPATQNTASANKSATASGAPATPSTMSGGRGNAAIRSGARGRMRRDGGGMRRSAILGVTLQELGLKVRGGIRSIR